MDAGIDNHHGLLWELGESLLLRLALTVPGFQYWARTILGLVVHGL